jgi:hypothetical protein
MTLVCVRAAAKKEWGGVTPTGVKPPDGVVCDNPHKRHRGRNRRHTTTVLMQSASSSVSVLTQSTSRLLVDSRWFR